MGIEHSVDGTDCRRLDHRELPDQLVTDLGRAPGRMRLLYPQDRAFSLVGQLVGLPIRGAATVIQCIKAAVLVTVEKSCSR